MTFFCQGIARHPEHRSTNWPARTRNRYVEGNIGGVLGRPESTGLVLGADARWHSGMTFTDALVGAAVTAAGVTIGVESGGGGFRFALHPEYGSFSTGTTKTTGFGGSITFSFAARREAQ